MAARLKLGRGAQALLLLTGLALYLGIRAALVQPPANTDSAASAHGNRPVSDPYAAVPPPQSAPAPNLSTRDQGKLAILNQVLASKNDNDPRLDDDLKGLTPELKAVLIGKYRQLPDEDRNGKGTIVFLLGRELKTPADVAFLEEVLKEVPCLSLSDCTKAPGNISSEQTHLESATGVTLAYPQLVALYALNKVKADAVTTGLGPAMRKALEAAQESTDAVVARKARTIASQQP